MFIVHKKGMKPDKNTPALLLRYGGFNISVSPAFSSLRLALLEEGSFMYPRTSAAGSEYGEGVARGGDEAEKAECL
jgi:prolyl oligopeptidase